MRTPRAWWRARQERKARAAHACAVAGAVQSGAWTVNQARTHLGLGTLPAEHVDGWWVGGGAFDCPPCRPPGGPGLHQGDTWTCPRGHTWTYEKNANREGAAAEAAGSAGDATEGGDGSEGHDLGQPAAEAAPPVRVGIEVEPFRDVMAEVLNEQARAQAAHDTREQYRLAFGYYPEDRWLIELIDDEIVRQLTDLVRDTPAVQAALEEIHG